MRRHVHGDDEISKDAKILLNHLEVMIKLALDIHSLQKQVDKSNHMNLSCMGTVKEVSGEEDLESISASRKTSKIYNQQHTGTQQFRSKSKKRQMVNKDRSLTPNSQRPKLESLMKVIERKRSPITIRQPPDIHISTNLSKLIDTSIISEADGKTPRGWRSVVKRNLQSKVNLTRCIFSYGNMG